MKNKNNYNINLIKLIILIIILIIIFYFIYTKFYKNIESFYSGNNNSQEKLNKTLLHISNIMNSNNIDDWFIAYGTLLGIIRENSCIEGDDDIDIVINVNYKDKLINILKNYGFSLDNRSCDRIIKTNETDEYSSIDFYLSEVDNNSNYKDNWEDVLWSNCYDQNNKLLKYEWKNIFLNLPNNYKIKLVNRYGEKWNIPQKSKGPKPRKKVI